MTKIHVAVKGDTLWDLSTRYYGTPTRYQHIWNANPALTNERNIPVGYDIVIPDIGEGTHPLQKSSTFGVDDVLTMEIDGEKVINFASLKISKAIDAFSTFSLVIPWDSSNLSHRKFFAPFTYKKVILRIAGELVLTGTLVNVVPSLSPTHQTLALDGYSTCGVLGDCTAPMSLQPLDLNDMSITEIIRVFCDAFGLMVQSTVKDDFDFEEIAYSVDQPVMEYLAQLAKKRGVLINDTPEGKVFVHKITPTQPIADFNQGDPPLLSVEATYNGQMGYTTHTGLVRVKGLEEEDIEDEGMSTIQDPLIKLSKIYRPTVFWIDDATAGDIGILTKHRVGRALADKIQYTLRVVGWRDPKGALWKAGAMISLVFPAVFVHNKTILLIKEVNFIMNDTEKTTEMLCVLAVAYTNQTLTTLPWEIK